MSKEVHRIYFCKDGAILDTQIREGEDVTYTLKRCFKKIADLEAKLAVSENTITNLIEDNRASQEWYKKQLAEKDEEIKKLEFLQFESEENKLILATSKRIKQDKISFALEQLEQLKHDIWTDQQDDGWLDEQVDIYFLTETIDNQIKKLTHQHEDKGE